MLIISSSREYKSIIRMYQYPASVRALIYLAIARNTRLVLEVTYENKTLFTRCYTFEASRCGAGGMASVPLRAEIQILRVPFEPTEF